MAHEVIVDFAAIARLPKIDGRRLAAESVILHFVALQETGDADHPGRIGEYMPYWDFSCDLQVDRERQMITLDFEGGFPLGRIRPEGSA